MYSDEVEKSILDRLVEIQKLLRTSIDRGNYFNDIDLTTLDKVEIEEATQEIATAYRRLSSLRNRIERQKIIEAFSNAALEINLN